MIKSGEHQFLPVDLSPLKSFAFLPSEVRLLWQVWNSNAHDQDTFNHYVLPNLNKIVELEEIIKGISTTLLRHYNITQFHRYDTQSLLHQVESEHNQQPFDLFLTSNYDSQPNPSPLDSNFFFHGVTPANINKKVVFAEFGSSPTKLKQTINNLLYLHGQSDQLIWSFHSHKGKILSGHHWEENDEYPQNRHKYLFHRHYIGGKQINLFVPNIERLVKIDGSIVLNTCDPDDFIQTLKNFQRSVLNLQTNTTEYGNKLAQLFHPE